MSEEDNNKSLIAFLLSIIGGLGLGTYFTSFGLFLFGTIFILSLFVISFSIDNLS